MLFSQLRDCLNVRQKALSRGPLTADYSNLGILS